MANETKKHPKTWHGDEVQPSPGDDAERAAQRAEGNGEIDVAEAVRPAEASPSGKPGERRHKGDDADAKIAEAAEAHQARRTSGDGPPRKTL